MFVRLLLSATLALGVCAGAQAGGPVALPSTKQLDLAAAERIAQAADQYAKQQGWVGSIAVVDNAGYPIVVRRMDGATAISAELAMRKAKASALFGAPSVNFENRVNDGHPALLALDVTTLAGGQPILVEGKVIGAVGVSTAVGAHDDPIAVAGSHALEGAR
ncbi:heme-binding protein [Pantoea sp. Tr-811]|uniref:GlcG/HbpS family heme-binding protein n=1 Tax=unclassified Pantoea TaxID=2630326 RepID=UPI00142492CB|nr:MULTISPECIES: heme-binding protein [unclassified Pantoea]NIE73661.1 heme-binding protein [Pantoea sp. Ap-967]NIF29015.1 heme-binding protein [Pantoea sp. Tr-811]